MCDYGKEQNLMSKLSEKPFIDIQGEGYMTLPMLFVRYQGCAVKCPIRVDCDEQESLLFGVGSWYSPRDILDLCETEWVCITGGEPLSDIHKQDLLSVVNLLKKNNKKIMVQTSGTLPISFKPDFLVVSPKSRAKELAIKKGDEIKVVVTENTTDAMLKEYSKLNFKHKYLQPLFKVTEKITREKILENTAWKLSVQMHKI
jgi:organic radical activating enzyme